MLFSAGMTGVSLLLIPLIFVLGTCVGSFVNVVVMRTLIGEEFVRGRSRCDHCRRPLEWFELIPLFSFLALRGRCRTCHHEIDVMHPVVELLSGALFLWWLLIGFAFFQLTQQPLHVIQPAFWLLTGLLLLVIVVTDLKAYIIPDWAVVTLLVVTLAYRLLLILMGVYNPQDLAWALFGSLLVFAGFFAVWLFTNGRGMGFGDVKLVFVLGLLMEWPTVFVGIWMSCVLGSVVGVGLILARRMKRGTPVPFGPFLVAGTVISLLWGNALLRWYLAFL